MAKASAGQKFPPPPVRSPFFQSDSATPASSYTLAGEKGKGQPTPDTISPPWIRHMQTISDTFNAGIPVTGSRNNGEALNQLLTALDSIGFIKNTSTE